MFVKNIKKGEKLWLRLTRWVLGNREVLWETVWSSSWKKTSKFEIINICEKPWTGMWNVRLNITTIRYVVRIHNNGVGIKKPFTAIYFEEYFGLFSVTFSVVRKRNLLGRRMFKFCSWRVESNGEESVEWGWLHVLVSIIITGDTFAFDRSTKENLTWSWNFHIWMKLSDFSKNFLSSSRYNNDTTNTKEEENNHSPAGN